MYVLKDCFSTREPYKKLIKQILIDNKMVIKSADT